MLAILAVPARAPAAAVPHGMFGMQDWRPPSEATMTPVATAGIERWRAPLFWDQVEGTKGGYDWSRYDQAVGASARSHMPLLAMILGCPRWACADGIGPPATPETLAAQRAFVTAAVLRYGNRGTFWTTHPELPRQPVTEWQVWNEVNHPDYWRPAPSAAGYASFLVGDAGAIRLADPAATVVLAGLSDVPPANAASFLSQLYAQPGFISSFDVMAVHAYASDARGVADLLDRVRQVEVQRGDGLRRMWMTEIGWGTASARLWTPTTEAQQATRMRQSFDMAIGCRPRWNLDRIFARRRLRNTRRAKLAFASSTGARFECRLLRGRAGRRWRRCGSRYRSARLRRGPYRLQVRAVDPAGATDPTAAVARLRRKGRQVLVAVRTR